MPYHPAEVIALDEAALLVRDGQTLALGGSLLYRRPTAFVRALLARPQRPSDLTLLCFTAGYAADLLVGSGMVRTVRTCYFGLDAFGLAPMYTERATDGRLHVQQESEASLALGIRAALGGVGFSPSRAWTGTDMLKLRPDVKTVIDPYTGESLVAFPAISCDVAVIHAVVADRHGNARLNKNLAIDQELAYLADTVIITAESVVDKLEDDVTLPAPLGHYVVEVPQGAWPTSCYPLYSIDGEALMAYTAACAVGDFERYVAQLVDQSNRS